MMRNIYKFSQPKSAYLSETVSHEEILPIVSLDNLSSSSRSMKSIMPTFPEDDFAFFFLFFDF